MNKGEYRLFHNVLLVISIILLKNEKYWSLIRRFHSYTVYICGESMPLFLEWLSSSFVLVVHSPHLHAHVANRNDDYDDDALLECEKADRCRTPK